MKLCGVTTGVGVTSFFHNSLRIYKKKMCFDTAVKIEKNFNKILIYLSKLMRRSISCRY